MKYKWHVPEVLCGKGSPCLLTLHCRTPILWAAPGVTGVQGGGVCAGGGGCCSGLQ